MKEQSIKPKAQGLYHPENEHDNCGIGLIANIKGKKSHSIIEKGIQMLERIEHRGAVGADETTGDGAGLLFQIPHEFFQRNIKLPKVGDYGVGQFFLPSGVEAKNIVMDLIETVLLEEEQEFITWRDVEINTDFVGITAKKTLPTFKQLFIKKNPKETNFEKRLYIIRRVIENRVEQLNLEDQAQFYIPSLSSETIVYKGLLLANQVSQFYKDLQDPLMKSAFVLLHQRFSTNTFPSWDLAHPFRFMAHNGEINTIKGNVNWMKARESALKCDSYGDEINKLFPICKLANSDSANLDSALEFLVHSGRPLIESIAMLVPCAWEKQVLDPNLKAFYEYNSYTMEPWDGPAAIALCSSSEIVCTLDRNGLRPSRYIVTCDDEIILASEAGTIDVPFDKVVKHGRLMPGKILYISLLEGKIYSEEETLQKLTQGKPYEALVEKCQHVLTESADVKGGSTADLESVISRLKIFGISREDLKINIAEMARSGKEPLGSMGNDIALAVLSDNSKHLFHYFKQLFAQVTNPPIDPIREAVVMSDTTVLGGRANILGQAICSSDIIKLNGPVISNEDLKQILKLTGRFQSKTINITYNYEKNSLEKALEGVYDSVKSAVNSGIKVIILSDRHVSETQKPIPSLLAMSYVHHQLIADKLRAEIDIIVETGEVKEVMQVATLIGYGALAVNPYLALETIAYLAKKGIYLEASSDDAILMYQKNFLKSCCSSLLKITSKMGISTIQSYRGAQIFECIGLDSDFVSRYFPGTPSRIGGMSFEGFSFLLEKQYKGIINSSDSGVFSLENLGEYRWRKEGEKRLFSPTAIANLQHATKIGDYSAYKKYSHCINEQSHALATLRGLFKFQGGQAIDISEVESIETIMTRFVTGAMSYGSISKEAHEALAIAMNSIGGQSNSGEGGEDPDRFMDNRRSAIKQIASGRFGVTTHYLVNADELQIKMAQGAKPGEGGHLPGKKVSESIAKVRHTSPGIDLISPPPHHDIYSIEDLAQLIFDLKNVNPTARISVKLVSEVGVGTVAAGVSKAHADMILVSGYDGGTGAAALSSIKHAGLPWELGLSEVQQVLVLNNLRGRVKIQADGQMKTGRDIAIAALLGAEEFGFSTAPLVVLGCVMMRACHTNMCPVGVATQDESLRRKFVGRSAYLVNYFKFVAMELREIMASLGFKTVDEMIGKSEYIEMQDSINHFKASGIDLSKILYKPEMDSSVSTRHTDNQNHGIDTVLDRILIKESKKALEHQEKVTIDKNVRNTDRTIGTMLSGEVAKRYGSKGLLDDTISLNLSGYAGQSFATFGMQGITFNLTGQGNDYVGKGLFGAKVIVKKPGTANYSASKNSIVGNTCFFGAIKGEAYINGLAGERFCVRNSGAFVVVEGIGDHGCEYMTGGRVLILGETGINFGAGMSGGIAYVWDLHGDFTSKVNTDMVEIDTVLNDADKIEIKRLLENHKVYTGSSVASKLLEDFSTYEKQIKKVAAPQYKKLLAEGLVK